MGSDEDISINMPSAPMPMPEGDATALTHPALVTQVAAIILVMPKKGLCAIQDDKQRLCGGGHEHANSNRSSTHNSFYKVSNVFLTLVKVSDYDI